MTIEYGLPEFRCIKVQNRIKLSGVMEFNSYSKVGEHIYTLSERNNVKKIIIDFSAVEGVKNCEMLAVIAIIINYREQKNTDFELLLPKNEYLNRLFHNANYAHYIDPLTFKKSSLDSISNFPAKRFLNDDERNQYVSEIMEIILQTTNELSRDSFRNLEWALNEITDNVLVHSRSEIGGLIQMTQFTKSKLFEFTVADLGMGIPRTLGRAHSFKRPEDALELAIKEGVTSDKTTCQGNGLFGTYELCSRSKGVLKVHSDHGLLLFSNEKLKLTNIRENFRGTYINARLRCDKPDLLDEILFEGQKHYPSDLIENKFETKENDLISFSVKDNSKSTGSRDAGLRLRRKIRNLYNMDKNKKISIDMKDVSIISSSFADEVFGKLVKEIGFLNFNQNFTITNITATNHNLIDKAINQRIAYKE